MLKSATKLEISSETRSPKFPCATVCSLKDKKYYKYWIPDGVKTNILEVPIPCYMLNEGLNKFTNNDGKTVEYYKVSFIE